MKKRKSRRPEESTPLRNSVIFSSWSAIHSPSTRQPWQGTGHWRWGETILTTKYWENPGGRTIWAQLEHMVGCSKCLGRGKKDMVNSAGTDRWTSAKWRSEQWVGGYQNSALEEVQNSGVKKERWLGGGGRQCYPENITDTNYRTRKAQSRKWDRRDEATGFLDQLYLLF